MRACTVSAVLSVSSACSVRRHTAMPSIQEHNREKISERFHFLPIPLTTPLHSIQWKLDCRSRKQKQRNQPITRPEVIPCHWFTLTLLLQTLTIQFSPDHKRQSHKWNLYSASEPLGLIFTGSYHSTLLIMTPNTTMSLLKTSLKCHRLNFSQDLKCLF